MPSTLENENVHLKNVSFFPADGILGHVSYYHFKIHDLRDDEVGQINFRIGNIDHILYVPVISILKSIACIDALFIHIMPAWQIQLQQYRLFYQLEF